jgi:diaminopimelate decarboxylase
MLDFGHCTPFPARSFNCILYDGQNPEYRIVRSPLLPSVAASSEATTFKSTLWGPTCDSADCVYKVGQDKRVYSLVG